MGIFEKVGGLFSKKSSATGQSDSESLDAQIASLNSNREQIQQAIDGGYHVPQDAVRMDQLNATLANLQAKRDAQSAPVDTPAAPAVTPRKLNEGDQIQRRLDNIKTAVKGKAT